LSGKPKNVKEKDLATTPRQKTELSRGFNSVFDDLTRTFDYMLSPFLPMKTWWSSSIEPLSVKAPLVDLVDKGDKYLIIADLPGYEKNDIEIQLNKDTLLLTTQKKTENEQSNQEYLHRERTYSSSERIINFAEEIDPSKVEAKMNNGVLEVVAPKKEPKPEQQMRRIELK
jgi:HSP20 family protein